MKSKLLILSFAAFICGCFGSPVRMAMISEDDLKEVSTLELCSSYGHFRLDKVKKELIARLISFQHGLEDRTAVHQYKSGKIVVLHQDKSGIKAKLPDKGEISSKSEIKPDDFKTVLPAKGEISSKRETSSSEVEKLMRLMKVKLAEQSPPDGWEWELIEKGEIKKGMTQCGLLASWGMPMRIIERSRRVDEWIYDRPYSDYSFVQIRKGKIKKWKK